MTDRWDPDTETYDYDMGMCPYCGDSMYENPDPDIKYVGYSRVWKNNSNDKNDVVLVCDQCIRQMEIRREVTLRRVSEWHYVYEFVHK